MRINEETILVGSRAVLVPYRKEHVPKVSTEYSGRDCEVTCLIDGLSSTSSQYHDWMSDEVIREQTASEPLTIEEEYEMQESWRQDEDKLTFIVLAKTVEDGAALETVLASCPMAGDVNLFLSQNGDADEDDTLSPVNAELEVMIAEPQWRHKGLAMEALSLLIHYATTTNSPIKAHTSPDQERTSAQSYLPVALNSFVAKVGFDNDGSSHLFKKLTFEEIKRSEVWREVELRPRDKGKELAELLTAPVSLLRWPLS